MSDALQKVTEIERAIARISTVEECKQRDAELAALRIYVEKRSKDVSLIKKIQKAQLRLKRHMGELLKKRPKAKPGPKKIGDTVSPNSLEEIGIDKKESSRAQKLADIPEDEFEMAVAEGTSQDKLLKKGARHPMHKGKHYPDAKKMLSKVDACLEGIFMTLDLITPEMMSGVDREEARKLSREICKWSREIERLACEVAKMALLETAKRGKSIHESSKKQTSDLGTPVARQT